MVLQEAGGDGVGHIAFDRLLNDGGLVVAEGQNDDFFRFENRTDSHRHGLVRHILLAEKPAGGIPGSDGSERHAARAAVARGTRLIEPDMTRTADTEYLQVDPTGLLDLTLIASAELIGLFGPYGAVGDVDVL